MSDIIDRLESLFLRRGAEAYLGEPVTVAEHMLQCAALAQAEAAPDRLVAAALLHDIGHLSEGAAGEYSPDDTIDKRHDRAGAKVLEGHFPAAVVEPVRLHVAAKRYLCGTDSSYYGKLSVASRHSLALQGGPMNAAEIGSFESLAFHRDAVRLRRWDDGGKVEGLRTPTFADLRPLLERLVGPSVLRGAAGQE
jgi:phosphonate degradation associated HDIG domain protein